MRFQIPDLAPAAPELFLLGMACVLLLVDVFLNQERRYISYWLAQLTLVGAACLSWPGQVSEVVEFSGTFVRDGMGDLLKVFIYLFTFGVFVYSREYLEQRGLFKGEFYVLGLLAVLGMVVMVSAHSLLTLYLGLELQALSLYALVAMHREDGAASEAAMKYFVLGALASGMLLYGMSMLYGATGSLDIGEIAGAIAGHRDGGVGGNGLLVFGLVFVVVGVGFKLGAVPFHMWAPDVYQGAPTPVTVFIGTAPKLAAFAMLMRLMVEAMGGLHDQWQPMFVILAVLSMAVGNIIAIAQTNIKRMLAYSTIGHVGFILLGFIAGNGPDGTGDGYAAAMFYVIVYALMTLGSFGVILLLARKGFEADRLDDFRGLNQRSPWFALMMLILMFSNAGVPPTVGFYAKWWVLRSVVDQGLVWLAIVGVVFAVVGAFYYLRIIRLMYFDRPLDDSPIRSSASMRLVLSINGLAVLALGLLPGGLMALCSRAAG